MIRKYKARVRAQRQRSYTELDIESEGKGGRDETWTDYEKKAEHAPTVTHAQAIDRFFLYHAK